MCSRRLNTSRHSGSPAASIMPYTIYPLPTNLRLLKTTPRRPRTSRRTPITMRPSIVLGSSIDGRVLTGFSACLVPEKDLLVGVCTGCGCVLGWLFWALSALGVCAFAWGVFAVPDPVLEDDGAVTGADAVLAPP